MADLVEVAQEDREWAADSFGYVSWEKAKSHSFRHDLLIERAEKFARHRIASIEKFKEENNK